MNLAVLQHDNNMTKSSVPPSNRKFFVSAGQFYQVVGQTLEIIISGSVLISQSCEQRGNVMTDNFVWSAP